MSNKFSQYGYFSVTSDMDKVSGNITECFDLNNTRDCAAVILCAHDGTEVSNLILHNLKVALRSSIFTDLAENVEIKDYLHDIFLCFDKKYLKDADQYLRKRGILNERLSKVELDAEIEDLYKSLEELERISKCGCTLSLAILLNDKLYVAHIGDNQIIISMNDEMAEENKFVLLTEEHNFYNKDEFQRIKNECELNANGLRNLYGKSYARYHSRCLGHYEMKYEYMNMEIFRHAKSQPIICVPQLTDGIKLNSKWCYMLFVSSGLYYLVMELIYDRDKIAGEIANEFVMIRKQKPNLNLSEICKLVIYKYLNIYKAAFEENSSFNMDFNKMDHEELTIMAIKLPQTDSALLSDSDEVDPNEKDEDLNEQFPDVQTVSFPFPYLSFDQWNRAESKMTDRELEKFDSIFSLMKIDEDLIIEEESNSVMKLSRATTVNDSNLSNDVLSDEIPDSLDSKMSNIEL